MNVILIVNANSFDFDIETFTTEPSNSDAIGSHADGRLVKYLKNLYIWHDDTGNWIKFPNSSDYDLFESELSTQISARQSSVGSLATGDSTLEDSISTEESTLTSSISSLEAERSQQVESLQLENSTEHANLSQELSSQTSARISAVDSEQARAESVEATISSALSTAIENREGNLSSETSRAQSAEADISANLSSAISVRESDISTEESRAESVESSLTTSISLESVNLQTEIASVESSLSGQEGTSSSEHSILFSALGQNTSLRSQAHSTIQSSVDAVDLQLSAMLFAAETDISTLSQLVSYISSVDLSHDTQTSQEFSNLQSAIGSAATVRSQEDSVLQEGIEVEALVRSQEDSVLQSSIDSITLFRSQEDSTLQSAIDSVAHTRSQQDVLLSTTISTQISTRAEEYSILESNISAETDIRDLEYASLSQAISSEISTELSREGSLENLILSVTSSLESVDSVLSSEISNQILNQGSVNSNLSSDFASDLASTTLARSQEDSVLQSTLILSQTVRSQEDSVLDSALGAEQSSQGSLLNSLSERLSIQESDRSSSNSALSSSVLSLGVERSQEDSALTSSVSIETSRVTSILADASILDSDALDTFVELVSFLTDVDTESDDALVDYISAIDSSIAAENSELLSMRDNQSQELSTQISARISSVDSMESRAMSAEYSLDIALSVVESYENARHLRVNFTNVTSLTVGTADLAGIGFNPGNGMVQVFREDSSGNLHRLITTSTFNPSTGEMTFDLGSLAKTGFAVFYSFGSSTSPATSNTTSNPQFKITGATLTSLDTTGSGDSVITLDIEGMTADNFDTLMNYTHEAAHFTGSPRSGYARNDIFGQPLTLSYNSDYSELIITLKSNTTPQLAMGSYYFYLFFGSHYSDDAQYYGKYLFQFDATTHELITTSNAGKVINDVGYALLSPPYMDGSGTLNSYSASANFWGNSKGPEFQINLNDVLDSNATVNWINNLPSDGGRDGYFGHRTSGVQFTRGGTDYYIADIGDNFPSSGDIYDELIDSRSAFANASSYTVQSYIYNEIMYFGWHWDTSSNVPAKSPDANSTVTFYIAPGQDRAPLTDVTDSTSYDNYRGNVDYASAIKIVIDLSDNSYEIYRDSNVGGTLTWTSVSRCYLSNQDV